MQGNPSHPSMLWQRAFTLLELLVVIAVIGVLAALALPRFMAIADDAQEAAVQATAGALSAGVIMVRGQWELNRARGQSSGSGPVTGFGTGNVIASATGWPLGTHNTGNAEACTEIWKNVMQGTIPSVATTGATADYLAIYVDMQCRYRYQRSGRHEIRYDTASGAVEVRAD